ncbi:nuclear transport factor 2 family protein [Parapedobacter sp. 10938]|uniref:nuclear transport factor 2 family protein n=1 Tax=Parapedobacter flavus TaxID=3110225 RepID=UPI002DBE6A59|nr:nuclear transport factor 2 family protein [Parapedobacter sp. 10938]MEC3878131.1 nuclear transport factor 2 family protein [Parapedobacter sp. 10938]
MERFRVALLSPQTSVLEDMTSEALTYGHSSGLMEDQDTFIHSVISGKFKFTQLEFNDQTVNIEGNTAIVRHTLFGHTADEGKEPATVALSVLTIWQKVNGKLRLLARQSVRKAPV